MASVLEERHDILDAIYHRRAVRAYTSEPPADDIVRELLNAAVQAPTAMHAEPWAFMIVQDKQTLKRLSDRSKQMLLDELKAGSDLARDVSTKNRLQAMLGDASFNIFYDAGTLILICGKPMGQFVTADCWLAAENLMLGVRSSWVPAA
jgi:nitroreductase